MVLTKNLGAPSLSPQESLSPHNLCALRMARVFDNSFGIISFRTLLQKPGSRYPPTHSVSQSCATSDSTRGGFSPSLLAHRGGNPHLAPFCLSPLSLFFATHLYPERSEGRASNSLTLVFTTHPEIAPITPFLA